MKAPKEKWLEMSYDVEGPLFVLAMLPFLHGRTKWKEYRFPKLTFVLYILVYYNLHTLNSDSHMFPICRLCF